MKRLGLGLYIIPLALIANPALIELAAEPMAALLVFMEIAVSLAAISYGVISPLNPIVRIVLTVAGFVGVFWGVW